MYVYVCACMCMLWCLLCRDAALWQDSHGRWLSGSSFLTALRNQCMPSCLESSSLLCTCSGCQWPKCGSGNLKTLGSTMEQLVSQCCHGYYHGSTAAERWCDHGLVDTVLAKIWRSLLAAVTLSSPSFWPCVISISVLHQLHMYIMLLSDIYSVLCAQYKH